MPASLFLFTAFVFAAQFAANTKFQGSGGMMRTFSLIKISGFYSCAKAFFFLSREK